MEPHSDPLCVVWGKRFPGGGQINPLPRYLSWLNPPHWALCYSCAARASCTDIRETVKRERQIDGRVRETGGRLSSSLSSTDQTNNHFLLWPGVQDTLYQVQAREGHREKRRKGKARQIDIERKAVKINKDRGRLWWNWKTGRET